MADFRCPLIAGEQSFTSWPLDRPKNRQPRATGLGYSAISHQTGV